MEALNPDEVAELLKEADKPKERKKATYQQIPGTDRKKRVDFDNRTYQGWFALNTTYGQCEVPTHDEEQSPRGRMVAEIAGVKVCRYCFLSQKDD